MALGLVDHLVDRDTYGRTVARFRDERILLPTFAELADPARIPASIQELLARVGPDDAHPLNLFRIHWYNDAERTGQVAVPGHVVLPRELTGVDARIAVVFGDRFPMIRAHKVLAAYGCLVPRIVAGEFDPTRHRAVWPSTGNYCRGGVAISRILGCRGVAVLPEGMSEERFEWLRRWVVDPADIITTRGTESNVKEIYDACEELDRDPATVVFNQFAEFGNHLVHYLCTGRALGAVFEALQARDPTRELRLRAFVSASGSAGTLGAGDHLKDHYGASIAAAEALECPTLLRNGFGEHNIQGIGDKHVPLIHNANNTDFVVDVTDRATDQLSVLFSSPEGLGYLHDRRGVPDDVLATLRSFGLSSICNVIAAVKLAKHLDLGEDDVIVTVATDGAEMYESERRRIEARDFPGGFGAASAGEVFAEWMLGADVDNLLETTTADRARIFNLGYFTWVEQRGVPIADFVARKDPSFWVALRSHLAEWDVMIEEFNARTGVAAEW
ncbi:MAG TPA: pyridoxal-5'-phosphate-dependent protein subunit beta [Acidimicrobiales bacterium]|nr:pyridoxal-5'-phosphate-dependent protein subunit beta [Acidimicrobiales bacterium]